MKENSAQNNNQSEDIKKTDIDSIGGKILFVDSDMFVLDKAKRTFMNSNFKVYTAMNGTMGLKMLETTNIDVVVTALKMPRMDGFRFLAHVSVKYPDIDRIIICTKEEQKKANMACKRGVASMTLQKPWEYGYLEDNIIKIFQNREVLQQKELLSEIAKIKVLPTLPKIYQELKEAINQQESYQRIADIIQSDVSMSTRILKLANSAFYGFQPTTSLVRGINILGSKELSEIVLTFALSSQIPLNEEQRQTLKAISIHSLVVNRYLEIFYRLKFEKPLPEDYSSVGITHDIGKIIQLQYFQEKHQRILQYLSENPMKSYYAAEEELGFDQYDHSKIGGYFLKNWKLPEPNYDIALYHHNSVSAMGERKQVLEMVDFVDSFSNFLWKNRTDENWNVYDFKKYSTFTPKILAEIGEQMRNDLSGGFEI